MLTLLACVGRVCVTQWLVECGRDSGNSKCCVVIQISELQTVCLEDAVHFASLGQFYGLIVYLFLLPSQDKLSKELQIRFDNSLFFSFAKLQDFMQSICLCHYSKTYKFNTGSCTRLKR